MHLKSASQIVGLLDNATRRLDAAGDPLLSIETQGLASVLAHTFDGSGIYQQKINLDDIEKVEKGFEDKVYPQINSVFKAISGGVEINNDSTTSLTDLCQHFDKAAIHNMTTSELSKCITIVEKIVAEDVNGAFASFEKYMLNFFGGIKIKANVPYCHFLPGARTKIEQNKQ